MTPPLRLTGATGATDATDADVVLTADVESAAAGAVPLLGAVADDVVDVVVDDELVLALVEAPMVPDMTLPPDAILIAGELLSAPVHPCQRTRCPRVSGGAGQVRSAANILRAEPDALDTAGTDADWSAPPLMLCTAKTPAKDVSTRDGTANSTTKVVVSHLPHTCNTRTHIGHTRERALCNCDSLRESGQLTD